ncbi:MAG: response regulator receiver protein [Rhodospirillales bacterium]|nr:response regulator receiver protein [Rhodospirillales bacterium]
MVDVQPKVLDARRILVVEDDYTIASNLAKSLENLGAVVVGPAGSVANAMLLIEGGAKLDAAVLDIHLGAEKVYPVAEALLTRGVPFVFTTGYSHASIPNAFAKQDLCEKPVDTRALARLLSARLAN